MASQIMSKTTMDIVFLNGMTFPLEREELKGAVLC